MLAARYSRRGLSLQEALRAARIQFGSATQTRESVHEHLCVMVLIRSIRIIISGAAVGICCAFFLTRLIQSLLYDVSSSDPFTMGVVFFFSRW
jgi:hypothetical protein